MLGSLELTKILKNLSMYAFVSTTLSIQVLQNFKSLCIRGGNPTDYNKENRKNTLRNMQKSIPFASNP